MVRKKGRLKHVPASHFPGLPSLVKVETQALKDSKKKGFALRQEQEKERANALQKLSEELFEAGHSMTEHDLSENAKKELFKVRTFGWGVCSRCRWQSGCLSCEPEHCLQYWMKKEKPKWLEQRLLEKLAGESSSPSA